MLIRTIRNEKQRLRTSKSARRKKRVTRDLQLQGDATKALHLLHTRPIVHLENIDINMNRRPDRNAHYYKSRNWNTFYDGSYNKRRRWHDLDDIWKPNYDYDDCDEWQTTKSTTENYNGQQFVNTGLDHNYYYNTSYPNYYRRNYYGKRGGNSYHNTLTYAQKQPSTKFNNTNYKYSMDTEVINQKGTEAKQHKPEKEEDRDSIAEKLQLIHGDEPEKDNKNVDDYEANFRFFNIDKNLSYLQNYGKPTAGSSDVINKRPVSTEIVKVAVKPLVQTVVKNSISEIQTNNCIGVNKSNEKSLDASKACLKPNTDNTKIIDNTKSIKSLYCLNDAFGQTVLNVAAPSNINKPICKKEKGNSDLNIKRQLSVSLTKKDSIIDKTDAQQSKHYKIPKNKILNMKNSSTCTQNSLGQLPQDNASKTTTSCAIISYKIVEGNDKFKVKKTSQKRKIDLDNGPSKLKLPKVTSEKLKSNIENIIKQSATNMPCLESAKSAEKKLLVLPNTQIEDSLKVENTSNTSAKIKRRRKTVAVTAEPKLQLINDVVNNETGLIAKTKSNIENLIKQSATNMLCLESTKSAEKKLLVLPNTHIEDSLKVENTSNTSAKIKRRRKTIAVTAEPKLQLINQVVDNETGLIAKARRIRSQSVEVNKPCSPRLTRSKSKTSKRTCKNETYKELSLSPIQIEYSHNCCKNSSSDANMKQLKRLSKKDHLPTTIPHVPLESNMKDPRLRKCTECAHCNSEADNLSVKPKIMPVTNKVGNKSVSSKKQISEDDLKFLFGEKFRKKSLNLTNPKPTCNLKNWDTRFQVNNDFIPETTADLMILNCLPLMEKASESIHESEMRTHGVNIPQILNDQCSVKQSVKPTDTNLIAIVQGPENFCININYGQTASAQVKVPNNPNMDVLPNINLPDCNKSNASATASSKSTTIERGLNTTQQPQINKTSANNVEVNKSQPKLNKQRRKSIYAPEEVPVNSAHRLNPVRYEEFTHKFYYAIFMNCVLDNTIMTKMKHFTSCGFPQEIVRREFEDYMGSFRSNMRRFSQSLCDYFQDRYIVNFDSKTLIYYCLRDYKNTGITLSMPFILKFFYFAANEVRRMVQPNGFLLEFCKKIEALYHSFVGMPNVSNTQVAYQQNRQFQPQEQVQQAQHHQQWQPPPTYQSSVEGNGANKNSKFTAEQMRLYKHQCEMYNTLIKNYRQKFEQPKCLPAARPTMNYTRGQVTSNVFNGLQNNTISREVNKPQPQQKLLTPTPESNTTPPNSNVTIVRAPVYKPGIEPTPQYNLQTNVSSNSNVTIVRAPVYKPGLDQTPQYNLQTDVSRSQPNTSACNTDLHFPLSEQTNTTGSTMISTGTLIATNLLQTMLNTSRSMEVIRSQFPNTVFSSTPPSSNLPVCNVLGPSPSKHFQTDEHSIPSSIVNKDLQCPVSERTDTTQFTENFKIHLPLSQPHGQNFTNTKPVSTTTNCAVSTLSSDSTGFDFKEIKPIIVQSENKDSEAIDVDEWFRNKLQESDFIDLDDYFYNTDDPVKNELNRELSQNNVNKENANTTDVEPRVGSVDSGFVSPPTQIKHPDVLSGERICICTKKAELMCLCGKAIYCSTNCQITDWNNHREQCIRTRETTSIS